MDEISIAKDVIENALHHIHEFSSVYRGDYRGYTDAFDAQWEASVRAARDEAKGQLRNEVENLQHLIDKVLSAQTAMENAWKLGGDSAAYRGARDAYAWTIAQLGMAISRALDIQLVTLKRITLTVIKGPKL